MPDFWDFEYEPKVIETNITTTETTNNYNGYVTTVTTQTKQVDVVTNWGTIARYGVILVLTMSICLVVNKLVTFWYKGR